MEEKVPVNDFVRTVASEKYRCNYNRCRSLFTDPLLSLQSPSSARDKKHNLGEFIDRQRKGVGVGEEERKEK